MTTNQSKTTKKEVMKKTQMIKIIHHKETVKKRMKTGLKQALKKTQSLLLMKMNFQMMILKTMMEKETKN